MLERVGWGEHGEPEHCRTFVLGFAGAHPNLRIGGAWLLPLFAGGGWEGETPFAGSRQGSTVAPGACLCVKKRTVDTAGTPLSLARQTSACPDAT